ncbi:MAG: DUF1499 domain-containing protein [Candidatus Hermodarchaeota archaeon]
MVIITKNPTGITEGKFYPCPKRHYCVSTQSNKKDGVNYIEPIKYSTSMEEAKMKLMDIIISLKRTKLLKEEENYLHYLFTTALFRFKDDVEFLFDDNEKIIHFKSQSRIGGYDWNTNRKRMENIRKLFLSEK